MARRISLTRQVVLLSLFIGALALVTAPLAWNWSGRMGVVAEGLAAAICLIAGVLSLACVSWMGERNRAITQCLVPMAFRLVLALGVAVAISLERGALFQSGFVYYLLLFYLLSLGPETVLLIYGMPVARLPQAAESVRT